MTRLEAIELSAFNGQSVWHVTYISKMLFKKKKKKGLRWEILSMSATLVEAVVCLV